MRWVFYICAILLVACRPDETISGQTNPQNTWVLKTINDHPVNTRITIHFLENRRISGQAPCNRYSGTQTLPLPWFKIERLTITKAACIDVAHTALEHTYLMVLQNMTIAEIADSTLILTNDQNETLVYEKSADTP